MSRTKTFASIIAVLALIGAGTVGVIANPAVFQRQNVDVEDIPKPRVTVRR